jgi:hypothetical protein
MKRSLFLPLPALALLALVPTAGARNFFELVNQGFQNGGGGGVRMDTTFQFNGPLLVFEEPGYFGAKSGLVDDNLNGPTLWARVLGGYDSNIAGFEAGDGGWFGGVQVGASENFKAGPQNVFLGARARVLRYDGDIFATGRDGNDSTIVDFDLRARFNRQFNQSVELTAFHHATIGGTREFGQPYPLPGVNRQDYLLYRPASQLVYRFDRAPVNDPGLQLTTTLRGILIKGLDNDDRDVQRTEVRQSIDSIVRDDLVVGVEGRFGTNRWDDWDMLDSTSFHLLATGGGRLANGLQYHAAAGWEWWSYDDNMIGDRDDFYAELKISGEVTNELYVAGGLTYGIDTVRPGRLFDSADPMSLKAAVTGVWNNGLYSVATLLTYTCYQADLISNANGHWDRWSAGINVDREIGADSRVGFSFEYAGIDTHQDNFEDISSTFRWIKDF